MRVTIYQPRYFPQLHYFHRILHADAFVVLESAQYTKALIHTGNGERKRCKSFQSDTIIKTGSDNPYLTVSVRHDGLLPLNQTKLDYGHAWNKKHAATIMFSYRKSPNYSVFYPQIKTLLSMKYETLSQLNLQTILWGLAGIFGWDNPTSLSLPEANELLKKEDVRLKNIILDSQLDVSRPDGIQKGTEWTTIICQELGATEHMHGETAQQGYMDLSFYKMNGVTPIVQKWTCREYPQQFPQVRFTANLSIIDLLMNVGRDRTKQILELS